MKALVLTANSRLEYLDWQDPVPAANEVLVKVRACGICRSDVLGMDGSTGKRIPPVIMGHEAAGEIAAVGKAVKNWKVGTPVALDAALYPLDDWFARKGLYNLGAGRIELGVSCAEYSRHGAFAELVAVPEHILYRIPEGVSYIQAALATPAAVAAHAVSLMPVHLNDAVVVAGAGILGLCLIQLLANVGCGKIIVIDLVDERLQLARDLGADVILQAEEEGLTDLILQNTSGRGVDLAFAASGNSGSLQQVISCVRKGGAVGLVGHRFTKAELALQQLVIRQIRLQGCSGSCGEYPAVLDMMGRRSLDVDALLSAVAPLADGAEWFRRLFDKEQQLLKVILQP
jgi:L-iditol 2-dehydrogenase